MFGHDVSPLGICLCFSKCLVNFHFSAKLLPQSSILHFQGFSPLCSIKWILRLCLCENNLSHPSQVQLYRWPVWLRLCLERCPLWLKLAMHPSQLHLYGRSPVWITWCTLSLHLALNDASQLGHGHLNGRSKEWFRRIWAMNSDFLGELNTHPGVLQLKQLMSFFESSGSVWMLVSSKRTTSRKLSFCWVECCWSTHFFNAEVEMFSGDDNDKLA